MLTPEQLPDRMSSQAIVTHQYPEDWDEVEMDQHRYDECPCSPTMLQMFSLCEHDYSGYHWVVNHRRIRVTEREAHK